MKIQAKVMVNSQPDMLKYRMSNEEMTHGQTVRADLQNIRVGQPAEKGIPVAAVFFCDSDLKVLKTLEEGDGNSLPDKVTVNNLKVNMPGHYDLKNVLITSNGSINVTVDKETEIVSIEE